MSRTTAVRQVPKYATVEPTELDGVSVVNRPVYRDDRGYFLELWKQSDSKEIGFASFSAQDNVTWSRHRVLRGLHLQWPFPQAKLVYVLVGEIFDVAVDVRFGSPKFAKWFGIRLSDTNHRQLFIPAGFAHGFCVLSESALVGYKCSEEYHPEAETSIAWNDPEISIRWPIGEPILSNKDAKAMRLDEIPIVRLPKWTPESA